MFGLGTAELVIILIIVIMVFGVGKLPLVAKQLGAGIRNFQKSVRGEDEEEEARRIEDRRNDNLTRDAASAEADKRETTNSL